MKETSSGVSPCMWYTSIYMVMFIRYVHVIHLEIPRMKCAGESDRQVRRKNGAKNSIVSGLGMYHLRPIHT
jgi:hypothetical protein